MDDIHIKLGSREYSVVLNGSAAEVNGQPVQLGKVRTDGTGGLVLHAGPRVLKGVFEAREEDGLATFRGHELDFSYETKRQRLLKRFASASHTAHNRADLKASMPGMVVRVVADLGSDVKKGQPVMILEAMKMENEIRSPIDGKVTDIKVAQGQPVEKGDLLMVLSS